MRGGGPRGGDEDKPETRGGEDEICADGEEDKMEAEVGRVDDCCWWMCEVLAISGAGSASSCSALELQTGVF